MALAFLCVLAFSHSADKTSKTAKHAKEVEAFTGGHSRIAWVADKARELVRLLRSSPPSTVWTSNRGESQRLVVSRFLNLSDESENALAGRPSSCQRMRASFEPRRLHGRCCEEGGIGSAHFVHSRVQCPGCRQLSDGPHIPKGLEEQPLAPALPFATRSRFVGDSLPKALPVRSLIGNPKCGCGTQRHHFRANARTSKFDRVAALAGIVS